MATCNTFFLCTSNGLYTSLLNMLKARVCLMCIVSYKLYHDTYIVSLNRVLLHVHLIIHKSTHLACLVTENE